MQETNKLKRGLSTRHIRFMALGSAIGTGLFYGSADAIKMAGPSVLLAYIIGGAVAYIIMRALRATSVLWRWDRRSAPGCFTARQMPSKWQAPAYCWPTSSAAPWRISSCARWARCRLTIRRPARFHATRRITSDRWRAISPAGRTALKS
ncbi:hypothetical protein F3I18_13735 [Pantoea sp. B_10]|nr:hypothetical protein F3I18_13735 [Pantoea sp. B_10]